MVDSFEELDVKEKYWIKFYDCQSPKGYNLTEGGDGISNPSEEINRKNSDSHKGKKASLETRQKMSMSQRKRKYPDHISIYCINCGKEFKVRPNSQQKYCSRICVQRSPIVRNSKSKKMLNRKIPLEVKEKISKTLQGNIPWNLGKKLTKEHREKLSLSHMGKKQSEEQKRKISDSLKDSYLRKRDMCLEQCHW